MSTKTNWPYAVAAITGASSGIGRALALEIGRCGSRVGLLSRRRDRLEEIAGEIRAFGGSARAAPCDVRSRNEVRDAIESTERALGTVDLLIACAGVGHPSFATDLDPRLVKEVYDVNLMGAIHAIEAVLPSMLRNGRGHVVGISSLAADRGLLGSGAYCASKAALNTQLESWRAELAPRGIRVMTVCPGFVRTPMTAPNRFPMPFLLEADEAARRIVGAIRRGRRVYRFPRRASALVRLLGLLPNAAFDRLARHSAKVEPQR